MSSACNFLKCVFFDKKSSFVTILITLIANKINLFWHQVIAQDVRKKHAKNFEVLSKTDGAVITFVSLPQKLNFGPGTQQYKTGFIPWHLRG